MMNNWMQRRWVLGLAVCAVTAASLRSGQTRPTIFPPIILRAAQGERLPPILSGAQLTGEHFRYPCRYTPISRRSRSAA